MTLISVTEFKKGITFESTVLATLKLQRAAYQGESFALIGFLVRLIQPLLSFSESTLRRFFRLCQFNI